MNTWPEYQDELERLAASGFEAWEIAEKLSVSRNAVIGRAQRTGVKINQDAVRARGTADAYPCGHPRTPENAYTWSAKTRCKACSNARSIAWYHKNREAA